MNKNDFFKYHHMLLMLATESAIQLEFKVQRKKKTQTNETRQEFSMEWTQYGTDSSAQCAGENIMKYGASQEADAAYCCFLTSKYLEHSLALLLLLAGSRFPLIYDLTLHIQISILLTLAFCVFYFNKA